MPRLTRPAALAALLVLGLTACVRPAGAQTAADSAGIRQAARDYIEGWYAGDSAQMRRALHPDLAKRVVYRDAKGVSAMQQTTATALVRSTGAGAGLGIPPAQRVADVRILDVNGDMATVRLTSARLVDYMHLARWDGQWKIVNVLWDFRPEFRPAPK